ncbi:MAG TPA: aminoglycoside adenylyltransferase domain-containing protein [Candidatus Baltobacteraceae bacterium]|jgi:streptomycin 3"-adenylyltransferase|nr:aminoglycoside adenylyltransferase domain-containing protein [Candidatus Baltobacteraceae bacterium]
MNSSRGRGVADADRDVRLFLVRVAGALGDLLGDTLNGLYVTGSLATGAYHRDRSDIDLIAVAGRALSRDERENVARLWLRLSDERPMRGDLDVDVVTEHAARNFEHPFPLEVHYDRANHESIRRRQIDYASSAFSADLPARIVEVRERGVTLVGAAPQSVFAPVPWHAYITALDLRLRQARASIEQRRAAGVLEACRVLYGTSNVPVRAINKDEAAVWALGVTPGRFHSALNDALQLYRGSKDADDVVFDLESALEFAGYVRERSNGAFTRANDTGEDDAAE